MDEERLAHRKHLRAVRREVEVRSRRMVAFRRAIWFLLFGGTLGLATLFLWPKPPEPAIAELLHGTVEVTVEADALILRQEAVYTAPVSGQVQRLIAEGQRVRVGDVPLTIGSGAGAGAPAAAKPATLEPNDLLTEIEQLASRIYDLAVAQTAARDRQDEAESNRLQAQMDQLALRQVALAKQDGSVVTLPPTAPEPRGAAAVVMVETAGVVVYQIDGLEELLAPGAAPWTPDRYRQLSLNPRKLAEGQVVLGAPVLKVVDNLNPSLMLVVPQEYLSYLASDRRFLIRFVGRDWEPVQASVVHHFAQNSELLLQLQVPALPDELNMVRKLRTSLVFAQVDGLVAPRSAIDVQEGRQGVWVADGGEPFFAPVRVLGGNASEVALETNLPPSTPVLRKPPPPKR